MKYTLHNPSQGSPIDSNGLVIGIGETVKVDEAVGKAFKRRYGFLVLSLVDLPANEAEDHVVEQMGEKRKVKRVKSKAKPKAKPKTKK